MVYLFPINSGIQIKSEEKKLSPIKKIGDEESQFDDNKHDFDKEKGFDQLEEKINKLICTKKVIETLDLMNLDVKAKYKLLEIVEEATVFFLKNELSNIAKTRLPVLEYENSMDIDDEDLSFSDQLAKFIMNLALIKKTKSQNFIKIKFGKANALEDKNAGFLVHYCKNILNKRNKLQKIKFKLRKLKKNDLIKF